MQFAQSSRLSNLSYEIPGPIAEHAARLEAEGHDVVKLATGDPFPFGFEAPAELIREIVDTLPSSAGYTTSKGLLSQQSNWRGLPA